MVSIGFSEMHTTLKRTAILAEINYLGSPPMLEFGLGVVTPMSPVNLYTVSGNIFFSTLERYLTLVTLFVSIATSSYQLLTGYSE